MQIPNDPAIRLKDLLVGTGLGPRMASILSIIGLISIILLLRWLSNLIAKHIIRVIVTRFVRKTKSAWDDISLEEKVFTRLSHFAPALVIWFIARWALKAYLQKHPVIEKGQTLLARHRDPAGNGIPLQVYAFTNRTDFITYENVQSEIFEHLLAMINEFVLKVFQQPTGDGLLTLSKTK